MGKLCSIIFLLFILLSGCETTPLQNSADNIRVGGRASGDNEHVRGKLGIGTKF
jgi:hypothetical protein